MSEKPYHPYTNNPLVHRDRRLGRSASAWVRSFACEDMSVLIVCRGPIRKEALDVFAEMGMTNVGILLSEKDSIVYPRALAPELRQIDPSRVHPVPDYTGATKEERRARIDQIIQICRDNGYRYVFAGYGFMAEDEGFVRAIEDAGLTFMGPCSHTVGAAGSKDTAKITALANDVSVTPGINNATARTLLRKHPDRAALSKLVQQQGLDVPALADAKLSIEALADEVLEASYRKGVDLFTVEELGEQIRADVAAMMAEYRGNRVRLKAIGGGGGKGQRILSKPEDAPGLVREILNEVKAAGVGDNKNILVELNIEQTRHNEIQLVGNGEWTISLGGRDCSLQMHEQKLLEVSVTREGLALARDEARAAGRDAEAKAIEQDMAILERMEAEAERFGTAVKLDSASTFECIVDGARHYFMEVNTRIQVEHRVSELCYALEFANPADAKDAFRVESLVECMALLAKHKKRLPRPVRVLREKAAVEARLNATDRSLAPHAGGEILSWSDPIRGEIRDDQGISAKNPDTGLFVRYKLAGAYDSNVALLVTTGEGRRDSYERLAEILRCTVLRGPDLATNLEFHYGLVHFFLSHGVMAKPTTRFVVPYLSLVGLLKEEANQIDLGYAYQQIGKAALAAAAGADDAAKKATRAVLDVKETLLTRPLARIFDEPHFLSAWLSKHRLDFEMQGARVKWRKNPVQVLAETYHLLNMNAQPGAPAAHVIWAQDAKILESALGFYAKLEARTGKLPYSELDAALRGAAPAFGFDAVLWERVRSAHAGFQLGLPLLDLLPRIAAKVGFYELRLEEDLTVHIPERLLDRDLAARMKKVLVPPPATKADEIVAASGGLFYAQEAPHLPAFVAEGSHFKVGDPLYIIEVMKMFNKVYAPFAGTVDKILVKSGEGSIVAKGQPLFKVTPDERVVDVDPAEVQRRIRENTQAHLSQIL